MARSKQKVSYFYRKDAVTGKRYKYARIVIKNELEKVRGVKFRMDSVYNAPFRCVGNANEYVQPYADPNYNINRAFKIYRKKMGLLNPKEIKRLRRALKLSQADVTAITGLSFSTLSSIEHGRVVQTLAQDTQLEVLTDWNFLKQLIKKRIIAFRTKQTTRAKLSDLKRAVKIIESKQSCRHDEKSLSARKEG